MGSTNKINLTSDVFGLPRATDWNCIPDSDPTEEYNCFAWAVHSQQYVIWPDKFGVCSWPPGMARNDTVEDIVEFLQIIGYRNCDNKHLVTGLEKIAIYAGPLGPLHLARQLANGKWASKLGPYADVIHSEPETVGGGEYGEPVRYMATIRTGKPPQLPDLHPGRPRLISTTGGILVQ